MKACYIHVPFCHAICSYCDFTRCRYHEGLANKWLCTIQKEIEIALCKAELETLYIGGGTPSALNPNQLRTLFQYLEPYTKYVDEYTIEANIDSLSDEHLSIMYMYGINRISLGVQTLQKELLKKVQRVSTREDALDAIQRIHEHNIHNISIDLMYGLPGQTMKQWMQDLQDIVEHFDIEHISLYSLTIEKHSQFGRDGVLPMEESLEADMFEYAISYLQEHGFEHYEISNFAKVGKRSKHNQMYWRYEDFAGIGCGASGKEQHHRYENTKNLQTYFEHGPTPEIIPLSKEDEMFEMLMMGLRTKDGVSLALFEERYGCQVEDVYAQALEIEQKRGRITLANGYVKATHQGMLLLHDVLVSFME